MYPLIMLVVVPLGSTWYALENGAGWWALPFYIFAQLMGMLLLAYHSHLLDVEERRNVLPNRIDRFDKRDI